MNKEYGNSKYYKIAARYLSGEMSEQEKKSFLHDVKKDPKLQQELFLLEKHWNRLGPGTDSFKNVPDTEKSWAALKHRITANGEEQPEFNIANRSRFGFSTYAAKIAASILLVVSVGLAVYWQLSEQADKAMISLNTGSENTTLVQSLEDGSVVYLADNSNFVYPKNFTNNERRVNLSGEAFFDVAKNPEQKFRVETGQAMIEVLGTSFNVKIIDENHTEVYVETGKVLVKMNNKPGLSRELSQGELLRITDNNFSDIVKTDTYNTAWRKNRMQFKDESLHKILNVISQNHDIDFLIEDEKLKERKLTLTIDDASPLLIGELIASSLNCSYKQKENNSIVFFDKE
ncbi:MAG: FecR family protein [Bacteroidales bacterium]